MVQECNKESFNPFQGCRWVLWNQQQIYVVSQVGFQSLSGLSLGSLIPEKDFVPLKAEEFQSLSGLSLGSLLKRNSQEVSFMMVSIPFRAVAGFFGIFRLI